MSRSIHSVWLPCVSIAVVSLIGKVCVAAETELPEAVQKTLKAKFKDASGYTVKVENEKGTKVYEIEWKDKSGRPYEVEIALDGKLIEQSYPIAAKQLPEKVRSAVRKKYPKGKILQAIKEVEGSETSYEVIVQSDGKKYEMEFDDDDDDDDDHDDDDDKDDDD